MYMTYKFYIFDSSIESGDILVEEILLFGAGVILISMSGVLSPGPLFATNVMHGIKGGARAGVKMAHGHAIVELPWIILLGAGTITLEALPQFHATIATLGAVGLFGFAVLQIREAYRRKDSKVAYFSHGPFVSGAMLTALNPFFILWWMTIGLKMITDATTMWHIAGIVILFGFHIWMDYVWMGAVGYASKRGSRLMSDAIYKIVMFALSAVLIFFGVNFLIEGINSIQPDSSTHGFLQ